MTNKKTTTTFTLQMFAPDYDEWVGLYGTIGNLTAATALLEEERSAWPRGEGPRFRIIKRTITETVVAE